MSKSACVVLQFLPLTHFLQSCMRKKALAKLFARHQSEQLLTFDDTAGINIAMHDMNKHLYIPYPCSKAFAFSIGFVANHLPPSLRQGI